MENMMSLLEHTIKHNSTLNITNSTNHKRSDDTRRSIDTHHLHISRAQSIRGDLSQRQHITEWT